MAKATKSKARSKMSVPGLLRVRGDGYGVGPVEYTNVLDGSSISMKEIDKHMDRGGRVLWNER